VVTIYTTRCNKKLHISYIKGIDVCGKEGLLLYIWMKWTVLPEENTCVYWDGETEFFGIFQNSDTADRHTIYLLQKHSGCRKETVV
jgi:hypothetical protein